LVANARLAAEIAVELVGKSNQAGPTGEAAPPVNPSFRSDP
jgi:hypothetical protein